MSLCLCLCHSFCLCFSVIISQPVSNPLSCFYHSLVLSACLPLSLSLGADFLSHCLLLVTVQLPLNICLSNNCNSISVYLQICVSLFQRQRKTNHERWKQGDKERETQGGRHIEKEQDRLDG